MEDHIKALVEKIRGGMDQETPSAEAKDAMAEILVILATSLVHIAAGLDPPKKA